MEKIHDYCATNAASSIGLHTGFLKESLTIIASAPIIWHGTASIPEQFRRAAGGGIGAAAVAWINPHNRIFAVAIQFGLLGAIVLWLMWVGHFWLFCGGGFAAWIGAVTVVENIVSSAVHSHLFDVMNGCLYVFRVGLLGGMTPQEGGAVRKDGAWMTIVI
jgi:O-antigen ligase